MPMDSLYAFPSCLGWMAIAGSGNFVRQLTFGHASRLEAIQSLSDALVDTAAKSKNWCPDLVSRLQAYAKGQAVDFLDIVCDPGPLTDFRRRVLQGCRQIRYGHTVTYGQLAASVGNGLAARAVGSCMASNRIPLIIPCHRVVSSCGSLGGFSAPGGVSMKHRLLTMESHT